MFHEIGILFDIDDLGGGFYRWQAYKIIFNNLDPKRLTACTFFDGDTTETLASHAREYCIAIQSSDTSKISYIKEAFGQLKEKGLLSVEKRFLDGNVTSQYPLVLAGEIDAGGNLVVKQGSGIGEGWVKETAWTVVKR
jgi:hypothetical protein